MIAQEQIRLALTQEQFDFFDENGFLRLEQVYTPEEIAAMGKDLDHIINTFAPWDGAWWGPWRKEYAPGQEDSVTLVAVQELHVYSAAWARAVMNPQFVGAVGALLESEDVELHHSTMHAKPPDAGAPFPLHQDFPFWPHEDGRYVEGLVHLDDADETAGCIKFLAGSHKLGPLEHIIGTEWTPRTWPRVVLEHFRESLPGRVQLIDGDSAPHLPTDKYRLQDAVSVPAKAGDVVLFHVWTVHGSAVNHSGRWRRLVRVGYRHPANRQISGQAMGRPGAMVSGIRPQVEGLEMNVYGNWSPSD